MFSLIDDAICLSRFDHLSWARSFGSKVLHYNDGYGLVVDATPYLCRLWPLSVESKQVKGKNLQTAVLTRNTLEEMKGFGLQETNSECFHRMN